MHLNQMFGYLVHTCFWFISIVDELDLGWLSWPNDSCYVWYRTLYFVHRYQKHCRNVVWKHRL